MAVLGPSQNTSGAADLEIAHCDPEAAAQIRVLLNGAEALLRDLAKHPVLAVHQKGVCRAAAPADTSAQLIQLRQSHLIRIMNDDGIDVGNIQTCLDNGRGDQHVDLTVNEIIHDLLQLRFLHLAVRVDDIGLRHELLQAECHILNVMNFVVDIVYLSLAGEFTKDRLPDHLLIIFHDVGLDRHTPFRRVLQNRHVSDPHKAHMKGSRDRRRGEGQNVHIFLHLLDLFFVGHAEALLLVHDKKTQVLELDVLGQKSVGADNNIAESLGDFLDSLLLLRGRAEAGKHTDSDRISAHPLAEGVVVLLRKDGRGDENSHLHALLDGFEGGPDGNLCFAIADVAADQAVHNPVALHISLGLFDGRELIVCLLVGEHLLEFLLPHSVGAELMPLLLPARRVQLHEVLCDLVHRALDFALGAGPFLRAELVELGLCGTRGRVFLQDRELRRQNIERSASAVLDLDIVLGDVIDLDLLHTPVDADTVILMDHVIAHLQLGEGLDLLALIFLLFGLLPALRAEDIGLRDDREPDGRIFKSLADLAVIGHDLAGFQLAFRILTVKRDESVRRQVLRQPPGPGPRGRDQDCPVTLLLESRKVLFEGVKALVKRRHGLCVDRNGKVRLHPAAAVCKTCQANTPVPQHLGSHFLAACKKRHLTGQHIALLRPAGHTLAEFRLDRAGVLVHSVRLIQIDGRRPLGEQMEKILCQRIEIMDIAFKRAELLPFHSLFFHLRDRCLEAVRLLCAVFIPPALLQLLLFLADPVQPVHEPSVRQDHFRRGIDLDRLQLGDRPLAEHVKRPDRIHLVAPQLNSIGVLLCQLEDVQNIAADRELSRLFYLVLLFIAEKDQTFCRLCEREFTSLSHFQHAFLQYIQRNLRRHQRGKCGDHRRGPAFHQASEASDPLCIQFPAPEISLVKDQVFGRKQHSVPVIETICLLDLPGSLVAVGHDQAESRCCREGLFPGQGVDQVKLLRLRASFCQNTDRVFRKCVNYSIVILRLLQRGC